MGNIMSKDSEKRRIAKKLIHVKSLPLFPYSFPSKYSLEDVVINRDDEGYPYVYHIGKKMFMIKEWSEYKCKEYYNSLRIEQDDSSPHKYFTDIGRYPTEYDVVADVGGAEGIFGLDVIDSINHLYIFEASEEWNTPLQKTFAPWKNKVTIVNRFVSNKDDANCVMLDSFFKDKEVTYLKADIEGSEMEMIMGGLETLGKKIKKALICTYHKPNDEILIGNKLKKLGFDISFNKGYMIFVYNIRTLKKPFLRRGIVYAERGIKGLEQ